MSSRTNLRPQVVIEDGDMSDDIISDPTILQSITKVSYELDWTGTSPIGTASVQVSNSYSLDPSGQVLNSGSWTTLTLSLNGAPVSSIPITGNTGTAFIDITVTAGYASRLVYTATSGVGTLNAIVNGKVS